jgi:hypothetical protein
MNRDFAEMLNALSDEGVGYLVVGVHRPSRKAGDIDLRVRPSQENALRLWRGLEQLPE